MDARRPTLSDPATVRALAHPVRLDLLGYLMSDGPATASQCARAIGDTPSNSSYHLRVLSGLGLVEEDASADGRERPWRATITGFTTDPGTSEASELLAASVQLDYQAAREYLRRRDELPTDWRDADVHAHYGLRVSAEEMRTIVEAIDAIVRPYIAAVRTDGPADAASVSFSMLALPRPNGSAS